MSLQTWVAVLLGFGALLAGARFFLQTRRQSMSRPGLISLLVLQPVAAGLLFLALFPPQVAQRSDRLVIASAGTTLAQVRRRGSDAIVLALPETPALPGAIRVPDLATALRQHPQAAQLVVLGHGLPARDRDAARGRALQFSAAPLPRGFIALQAPSHATIGRRWQVMGEVSGVPDGSVELLDPSGRRAELSALTADGRFQLHGSATAPGRASYRLRLRDARKKTIEQLPLPIQIDNGSSLRVLVMAGGPSPELKYLRRWAVDAGISLRTQINVGAGLRIGDPPVSFDAATLRDYDLLLLDERAWRDLGSARKAALREALRDGLGVLLRITGPLSPVERREFQALGFSVAAANIPQSISLPPDSLDQTSRAASAAGSIATKTSPSPSNDAIAAKADADDSPVLTRQPLRITADDGVALIREDSGAPLAVWRNEGQGRVALWWLGDSYRLSLSGQSAAHGRLWSQAFATLARASGKERPWLQDKDPRPNQRLVVCGLATSSTVVAPDRSRSSLLVDPASGCAAYWPSEPGWHVLHDKDTALAFRVRTNDEAPGVRAQLDTEATRQLVSAVAVANPQSRAHHPGPRWPWFIGWLLSSALLWLLERRWLRGA